MITIQFSQEIILDLKSKLKSANESVPKSATPVSQPSTGAEVKGQPIKRQKSKPSFYLELNRNSSQNTSDFSNKNKRELKVLKHQMSDELRHLVIQMMRQLTQTVDTLKELPDLLTKKLNKTFGKYWFCVIGENVVENCKLNSPDKSYLKCEINENYQIIVFKCYSEFSPNTSLENNQVIY